MAALSNETLKLIANRDFIDKEGKNQKGLIQAFKGYIRESSNPTVTVVELFTMKRHPHETADNLNARINEKLNQIDFTVITDICDYFVMTTTVIANDPALCKRIYLDKVDTYAKEHAAVKVDEQAQVHSKMVSSAA
jgi:O-acetyl-ADP-ribose deacetylase (regulator of RNase III)